MHCKTRTPYFSLFLFAALFLAGPVGAATQNPELAAHVGEGDDPTIKSKALAIRRLDIDVNIIGDTARTSVTANFVNSGNQALEGQFSFDLPPNSVVTGYALDIGDQMVDGVLVGQRQAKLTYESRVRRGVDPGLAEVTRSNAFSTRVFPILPARGRTIRLEFVTPLNPDTGFSIPLVTEQAVGAVSIHVKTDSATAPRLQSPEGIALDWQRSASGFEARAVAENRSLAGALVLGPVTLAQPLQLGRQQPGDVFFEINDTAPAADMANAHPSRVRIYWDSSLSRRAADLSKEIALVGRYIDAVHPAMVDLVFYSADAPLRRTLTSPSATEVTAILAVTDYRGATSLKPVLNPGLPGADACLLFSDGNITVDAYDAPRLPCPLYAVSSAADANRGFLTALAQKSAGDYMDLTAQTPDIALAHLLHRTPRVISVTDSTGRPLDYVLLPTDGDRFRIIGHAPLSGEITVNLARALQDKKTYSVDRGDINSNTNLGALWASRRVAEMSAMERPDQTQMLTFARRYSVASPAASFVVFENIQDYVEAGVEPPAILGKQMFAEYNRIKDQRDAQAADAQRDRLTNIVRMWTEEKQWWQNRFPIVLQQKKPSAQSAPVAAPNVTMSAPAPSPPPPAGMVPPSTGGANETVTVTGTTIRGQAPVGANVISVDRNGIEQTGAQTTQQLRSTIPQLSDFGGGAQDPSIQVTIADWNPDRPYIKALDAAKPDTYWNVYRGQEKEFGGLPAFYLDVAEFFFRHGKAAQAIQIALNALELPSANTGTMTILADRLMRYGDETRAIWLYDHILYLEPDRPQPRRNLALALIGRAQHSKSPEAQRQDYGRALDLLNDVVTHTWSVAFDGIEIVSLMEANHIVPRLQKLGVKKLPLDPRLIAKLDVDLRIILEWNTDETDMDLWVDEPNGERAFYGHQKTTFGGRLSNDMTNGYGPEEYLLRNAPNGTYTVRANVYAADRLNPNGATNIRAHIFRNYGRADEQEQVLELELKRDGNNSPLLGTIKVGSDQKS